MDVHMTAEDARVLAEKVLHARLPRLMDCGVNAKGRIVGEVVGERTPEETLWFALRAEASAGRVRFT